MKQFVLISVNFRKDLGQIRRREFASEMKERDWNREISDAAAWGKRIDENPGERAKTDVRRAANEVGIKQGNAVLQVSNQKPEDF